MYARLWWKDARQFWPIWLVVFVAAAVTQGLMLILAGREVRQGALFAPALLWAGLYALAAGAAAFAAERETGTLRLLDILSADRRVVWAGKTSFAIVSTLGLGAILLLMAAAGTKGWDSPNPLTPLSAFVVCIFVLLALGWGLFWSSILKSALAAALAAMCCTGLLLGYFLQYRNFNLSGQPSFIQLFGLAEFGVLVATIAASGVFFTRSTRRSRMPFQLRSPIVFSGSGSKRHARIRLQSPGAAVAPRSPRPIAVVRQPRAATAAPRLRRSWIVEARALLWQTIKEGRKFWSMLAAISVVMPVLFYFCGGYYLDGSWLLSFSFIVVTAAGASVFGLENRARTQRFLGHHGARPGSVWLVKITAWTFGLAVIVVMLAYVVSFMGHPGRPMERLSLPIVCFPLAYAVAVICGMALRRGITAFVIAVVASIGLGAPLIYLTEENMLSAAGLLVVAVALLAISWAWRRDWMLERPAPGRWLRLGLFFAVAFAVLSSSYIGFRAWSVPDSGPIAPPEAWARAASIEMTPDRNAAVLYEDARRMLIYRNEDYAFLNQNKVALDLIRRAAARPDCRFERPDRPTLLNQNIVLPVVQLARLVSNEGHRRLLKSDLAGSWDDAIVLFHMARHFAEGSGVDDARAALVGVEREGLMLALDWANAPRQTTERLRAALDAYRKLPKMPPASDVVRAEANAVENTLNLPADKLHRYLEDLLYGPLPGETDNYRQLVRFGMVDLVTTPWELRRARRVNRAVAAAAIEFASREPGHRIDQEWQWQTRAYLDQQNNLPGPLQRLSQPAESYIFVDDQNEVVRRALVQIIAIRIWQLKHDGQFPERLDALVPDELSSLPSDPYSDRLFGYAPSSGGGIILPELALFGTVVVSDATLVTPKPGSWLLYSVGHDRQDDGGTSNSKTFPGRDLVFVIPPVAKTAGAGKDKAESTPRDRQTEPAKPK
jgi:ABC-2 family transporter protein